METKKKTVSTKVETIVEEADKLNDQRIKEALKPGSQLLDKQKEGTARVIHTAPVTTNRPVNIYVERVVNYQDGEVGFWIWYTTEQDDSIGRKRLVEINHGTLEEIEQGFEWSIPYTKKEAEKVASKSYGKTGFNFKDGQSKTIISRELFLDYKR